MNSIRQKMQEIHLVGGKKYCLLDEKRLTGIQQTVNAESNILGGRRQAAVKPNEPSQLLHV